MKTFYKKNVTLIVTLLAAGSIFAVIAYNGSQNDSEAKQPQKPVQETKKAVDEPQKILTKVAIKNITVGTYQAEVIGFGEAKSRFELNYTSEVNARVNWLSENFEEGVQVAKGDLLATLDNSEYEQLVSQAKSDLATAELELLEEQREGEQARAEWERSGLTGKPASSLVFRDPQLVSAQASVENAKKSLIKAQRDLAYTEIRAPFDSIITTRNIQPGSYVSVGGAIATLYSIEQLDIEIPLSAQQWSNLPAGHINESSQATVFDSVGNHQWPANIARAHQYIDETTRQRSIVLTVKSPLANQYQLFPGTFVQAKIPGKKIDNIWQLPASSLSQQGEVWIVNEQGLLNKFTATVLFEQNNYVYIKPVVNTDVTKVAVRPLSNFIAGMKVSPQVMNEGES